MIQKMEVRFGKDLNGKSAYSIVCLSNLCGCEGKKASNLCLNFSISTVMHASDLEYLGSNGWKFDPKFFPHTRTVRLRTTRRKEPNPKALYKRGESKWMYFSMRKFCAITHKSVAIGAPRRNC